jgi:hypothetical protein
MLTCSTYCTVHACMRLCETTRLISLSPQQLLPAPIPLSSSQHLLSGSSPRLGHVSLPPLQTRTLDVRQRLHVALTYTPEHHHVWTPKKYNLRNEQIYNNFFFFTPPDPIPVILQFWWPWTLIKGFSMLIPWPREELKLAGGLRKDGSTCERTNHVPSIVLSGLFRTHAARKFPPP